MIRFLAPALLLLLSHAPALATQQALDEAGFVVLRGADTLAAEDPALPAIVLMAGPSWTGRRTIDYQNRYLIENNPAIPVAARGSLLAASQAQLDSMMAAHVPWMRYFLMYDPLPTARRVHAPVLILQGATERQITAEQAEELGQCVFSPI